MLSPQLESLLRNRFGEDWFEFLKDEFEKEYFVKLLQIVAKERKEKIIYPEKEDVFKAFKLCPLEQTKVVIIGQDPYHDGSAMGLAFGTLKDNPSLQKILKQLEFYEEFGEIEMCPSREPTLEYLADQGVLLLNRYLTVRRGQARSHAGIGWGKFTAVILAKLSRKRHNIVYMLWGRDAQDAAKYIEYMGNQVLITEHPAAAAYGDRPWNDERCFYRANEYLKNVNKKTINW